MNNRIARGVTDRLIQYLREEGISDELPAVAELLQREADRRLVVTVVSAADLDEHTRNELHQTLQAKWGERDIQFSTDPTLLSGMIIAFKDQVIDMSGRNALTDLKGQLS